MSGRIGRAELREQTRAALRREWERYWEDLPPHAAQWASGAAYIRESGANSMVSDAPTTQLASTLAMLAAEQVYVPWDHVFFENASASEMATRLEFQGLIDRARRGEFAVIGAYLSNRLFRNSDEASVVKRELHKLGIRLAWTGKVNMDPRDPLAWSMEKTVDINDELHCRQTGWYVGRAYERKSRRGEPAAKVPEMWKPVEWAPGLQGGRAGRPIRWELSQPLASHVRDGARRYLDGASSRELAAWSRRVGVRTPRGRPLTNEWWRRQLKNPKIAGFQYASEYMGYKPGKESPPRKPNSERELVPCVLPPLIDWEQFNQLQAAMRGRRRAPAVRPSYRIDLLSGVAYDASCGHRMFIRHRHAVTGEVFMQCKADRADDRHAQAFRIDEATEYVDQLIARLLFKDQALLDKIEAELDRLTEAPPAPSDVRSPEAEQLRAALAALDGEQFVDLRESLEQRLTMLEATTTPPIDTPARRFAAAISDLRNWSEIWGRADILRKNQLLKSAGLKVYIERIEPPATKARRHNKKAAVRHQTRRPFCRVVRIESGVPELALALAAGLSCEDLPDNTSVPRQMSATRHTPITLLDEHAQALAGIRKPQLQSLAA